MNLEIALTLGAIVLVLVAFLREWAPPEVVAMSALCLVVVLGLVPAGQMAEVFRNEAPLTIAALFIIGGALEQTGAVARMGEFLKRRLRSGLRGSILAISLLTAFGSAWMNNTAIVAILLPVVLGFARSRDLAAGRLLMPLSYASILGGCCTLVGTSTNLLANGVLVNLGQPRLTMFELAPVGVPLAVVGIAYLVVFGPRLIPARSSAAAMLPGPQRSKELYHLMVHPDSPLVGLRWTDSPLATDLEVVEVRRGGRRLSDHLDDLTIERFDRFLVALHGQKPEGVEAALDPHGLQVLAEVEGLITELVIGTDSTLRGSSLGSLDFRQRYNALVLAIHRDGQNISGELRDVLLEPGDTLLVVTPAFNLRELRESHDFVLTDAPSGGPALRPRHALLAVSMLAAAILTTTVTDLLHTRVPSVPVVPIHLAALIAALVLLWARTITPREAYAAIDWQVLFMLYGLLGLGLAMQTTGTAAFLAHGLVDWTSSLVSPELLPYVLLWGLFLFTLLLTEVLSNNATAVMMLPLVIPMAGELDVAARPFVIGVILASSLAFALPMGYQTHLMVYGPGGFRFRDFLRVGLPLNFLCWITACLLIPLIWSFR